MTNPYVAMRRSPKMLIVLAALTIGGIDQVIRAQYADGAMFLGVVAMFLLLMADLPHRSVIAARIYDVLFVLMLGCLVWGFLH
jgi:hypothetical protein